MKREYKEYIEREAAKERLRIWITDCVLAGDNDEADCYRDCIDLLDSIPAADVAEVRHGKWIGIDSSFWKPTHSSDIPVFRKTYRCSECRRRTAIAENYCPNCGAKMDKEEADDKKQPEEAPGE